MKWIRPLGLFTLSLAVTAGFLIRADLATVAAQQKQDPPPVQGEKGEKQPPQEKEADKKGNQQGKEANAKAEPPAAALMKSVAIPTGNRDTSVLMMEVKAPESVRVGQQYEYEIRLTNLTKELMLDNIRVHQQKSDTMSLASSEPELNREPNQPQWTTPRIPPGATHIIKVRAVAEREGDAASCLRVTYEPALCLMTKFVKAEIQLTKEAPAEVHICDQIPIKYTIRNSGSATAKGLTLRDPLPEGLTTADGKKQVEIPVGDLAAGQSQDHTVQAVAARAGSYQSRATASAEGGLEANSAQTTTIVRQPKLELSFDAPNALYANTPASVGIRVKNTGDAPARNAKLQFQTNQKVRVVQVGKVAPTGKEATNNEGGAISWDLGDLNPGDERAVGITLVGSESGPVTANATVTSECARDLADARGQVVANMDVVTLPALMLAIGDTPDPVPVGSEVTYNISVMNQGTGPDKNVQVVVVLPEQLDYIGIEGATEAKVEGKRVLLQPTPTLEPKAKLEWVLRAKANAVGDVKTQAELSSEYLKQPAVSQEPTRLVEGKKK